MKFVFTALAVVFGWASIILLVKMTSSLWWSFLAFPTWILTGLSAHAAGWLGDEYNY